MIVVPNALRHLGHAGPICTVNTDFLICGRAGGRSGVCFCAGLFARVFFVFSLSRASVSENVLEGARPQATLSPDRVSGTCSSPRAWPPRPLRLPGGRVMPQTHLPLLRKSQGLARANVLTKRSLETRPLSSLLSGAPVSALITADVCAAQPRASLSPPD